MTYWVSKNYQRIGSPEYIGFAQYRRILVHEDWMLQPNAIVCTVENGSNSLYQQYSVYHVKSDMDFVISMVQENFPQLFKSFINFLSQPMNFSRNMFIMHKDKFQMYSRFICKCIEVLTNDLLQSSDIKQRDRYQKRALAFLLERLTGFWMYDQMIKHESNAVIVPIRGFNIESPYQRP